MDNDGRHAYFGGMPDLDLEPHQYAKRDPRTGKMVREFSPKWARNWFFLCAVALIWCFWYCGQGSPQLSFGVTAFWAFLAGGFAGHWLKNIY